MTILAAVPGSEGRLTIETRASCAVCLTALGIAAVSFAAPAITVVGLKSIASDLGGERSVPPLAYSLAWLWRIRRRHRDRSGRRAVWGARNGDFRVADDCCGSVVGTKRRRPAPAHGYGVFIGLLGNAGMNAP